MLGRTAAQRGTSLRVHHHPGTSLDPDRRDELEHRRVGVPGPPGDPFAERVRDERRRPTQFLRERRRENTGDGEQAVLRCEHRCRWALCHHPAHLRRRLRPRPGDEPHGGGVTVRDPPDRRRVRPGPEPHKQLGDLVDPEVGAGRELHVPARRERRRRQDAHPQTEIHVPPHPQRELGPDLGGETVGVVDDEEPALDVGNHPVLDPVDVRPAVRPAGERGRPAAAVRARHRHHGVRRRQSGRQPWRLDPGLGASWWHHANISRDTAGEGPMHRGEVPGGVPGGGAGISPPGAGAWPTASVAGVLLSTPDGA